ARMSIVLPALNGMITRIGLAGQLCAQLTRGSAGVMAAAAMSCKWRRRVCCKDTPPLIGHELKAARACCLTFSLLVVFVCQQSPSAFAYPTREGPNFGFAALGRFHYCAAMLLARITSPQS